MKESQFNNRIWANKDRFTTKQICDILDIAPEQLETLIKVYDFPVKRWNKSRIFLKDQIIQWIDKNIIELETSQTIIEERWKLNLGFTVHLLRKGA